MGTLAGRLGVVSANGGKGYIWDGGGGGGAGRVALYSNANNYLGAIIAQGGQGYNAWAGAGTVYTMLTGPGNTGLLTVDNGGNNGPRTPLDTASMTVLADLTVANGAVVQPATGIPIRNLFVGNNGTMTGVPTGATTPLNIFVQGTATIVRTGYVEVDGLGYGAGSGPSGSVSITSAAAAGTAASAAATTPAILGSVVSYCDRTLGLRQRRRRQRWRRRRHRVPDGRGRAATQRHAERQWV